MKAILNAQRIAELIILIAVVLQVWVIVWAVRHAISGC